MTLMIAFSQSFVEDMLNGSAFNRHSDVKIILTMDPSKEFHPQKAILAANSTFFRKMFYNDTKSVYEIGGISYEDWSIWRMEDLSATLHYLGCEKIIENHRRQIESGAALIMKYLA